MRELLFVFIGGGMGSMLRFIVSMLWKHMSLNPKYAEVTFPWPTFIVNILGCFMIGVFYEYSSNWNISHEMRLLLTTGLCGGFTTFSTFSYEGTMLLHNGYYTVYIAYVFLSIILGLVASFLPSAINHYI